MVGDARALGRGVGDRGRSRIDPWGFERVGLAEVVSFTRPENRASLRVIEKLGMTSVRAFERRGLPHLLYRLSA